MKRHCIRCGNQVIKTNNPKGFVFKCKCTFSDKIENVYYWKTTSSYIEIPIAF